MAPSRGPVTFLFTDIEGSTRLWEAHPEEQRLPPPREVGSMSVTSLLVANRGEIAIRVTRASNVPVAKLATNWKQQWSAYDEITRDFDETDRRKIFHDNAARFYRLG